MKPLYNKICLLIGYGMLIANAAFSQVIPDSVVITPTADNTIYQRNAANSNGAGEFFIAGSTGSPYFNRALIRFNLVGQIPVGKTIVGAKLTLYLAATSGLSNSYDIILHKVKEDWGEGLSNAGTQAGLGAAATNGDATWTSRFYPASPWITIGGAYEASATASVAVNQPAFYSWSSSGMVSDIQSWITNPTTNFGWLLKSDELASYQAKRFASRENSNVNLRPKLTIYYVTTPINKKPTVTIVSPSNNSVFNVGQNILLQANASDSDGVVTRVKFYERGSEFLNDSISPYAFSGNEVEPGLYLVTARAFDNTGDSTLSDTVRITVNGCLAQGNISAHGYTNISGTQVQDLLNHPSYPNSPSISTSLTSFEYSNVGSNYGGKLSGFICAPLTGNYTFYIAGDDQAGLWLSTDETETNKRLIAYNINPVGFRAWNTVSTQKSIPVRLIKGAKYYVETLHKQSTGSNHLSVGWTLPNQLNEFPIPGSRLTGNLLTGNLLGSNQKFLLEPKEMSSVKMIVQSLSGTQTAEVSISGESAHYFDLHLVDVNGIIVEKISTVRAGSIIKIGTRQPIGGIFFVKLLDRTNGQFITRKVFLH